MRACVRERMYVYVCLCVCLYKHICIQHGMTALLLACEVGHEEVGTMLAVPTHASGTIDVLVCAWLYVSLSLSICLSASTCWFVTRLEMLCALMWTVVE